MLKEWLDESYRAQAPKKLVRDARRPEERRHRTETQAQTEEEKGLSYAPRTSTSARLCSSRLSPIDSTVFSAESSSPMRAAVTVSTAV